MPLLEELTGDEDLTISYKTSYLLFRYGLFKKLNGSFFYDVLIFYNIRTD